MTVSFDRNSVNLWVTHQPTAGEPFQKGETMQFDDSGNYATCIEALGEVTLTGAAGDDAWGWTAGFIQVQWVETNWQYYRGQHNTDGSIFIQRGRLPARSSQACLDCVDNFPHTLFYSTDPGYKEIKTGRGSRTMFPHPHTLQVRHYDNPWDYCPLTLKNTLTGQTNYLHEAQIELFFCTMLSVQEPGGTFHHLAHFYWNKRWQAMFQPQLQKPLIDGWPQFDITAKMHEAHASHIYKGAPADRRFTGILTSHQLQSCNVVAAFARADATDPNPKNRHESKVWAMPDVTKP